MDTERYLNSLKEEYKKTEPSLHLKLYGLRDLLPNLEERKKLRLNFFFRLAYVGVAVLILVVVSLGVYKTAKASLPGSPLYPVKLLSEEIINTASGNNQETIDNRAEEIVNLVKENEDNDEELEDVVRQYSQNVRSAPIKDEEFEKRLDEHHQRFERSVEESPEHEEDIREAIDASQTHEDNGNGEDDESPEVRGSNTSNSSKGKEND